MDPRSAATMMNSVEAHAAEVGLEYRFDTMLFGDTTKAHALVKAIPDEGLKQELIEQLYKSCATDGQSIFDHHSLATIASGLGINASLIDNAWSDESLSKLIDDDENTANAISPSVPLFVFNEEFFISGAQQISAFTKALEQMQSSIKPPELLQGKSCGLNECEK